MFSFAWVAGTTLFPLASTELGMVGSKRPREYEKTAGVFTVKSTLSTAAVVYVLTTPRSVASHAFGRPLPDLLYARIV